MYGYSIKEIILKLAHNYLSKIESSIVNSDNDYTDKNKNKDNYKNKNKKSDSFVLNETMPIAKVEVTSVAEVKMGEAQLLDQFQGI